MILSLNRKLGCWETLHAVLHDTANGHGIISGVVSISGQLSTKCIIQALNCLYQKHPLLKAKLIQNKNDYYFDCSVSFSSIPLHIIQKKTAIQWMNVLENELATPLIVDHHLWRALILTDMTGDKGCSTEIILTLSHSICDGISAVSLLKNLLIFYNQVYQGNKIPISKLPLLSPVEKLLTKTTSFSDYFKKNNLNHQAQWKYHQFVSIPMRKTKLNCQSFGVQQLSAFNSYCEKYHISLHALLSSALIKALSKQSNDTKNIALQTPVNIRRYCRPRVTNEHLGCYVTMLTTIHDLILHKPLWQMSKEYKEKCISVICKSRFLPTHITKKEIKAIINTFCVNNNDHFSLGLGVSSMGKIDLNYLPENHQVKFLYGCLSRQVGDFIMLMCNVIHDNQLFCTFSYTQPLLKDAWINALIENFISILTVETRSNV